MLAELTRIYAGVNLVLVVDYVDDGVSLEEVHHKGDDITDIVSADDFEYLQSWAAEKHANILESDKADRADRQRKERIEDD